MQLPGTRPRVLIVENDNALRSLLAQTLRDADYDVLEAYDGDDAAKLLAIDFSRFEPITAVDVLVTDVRMPRASGLDLLASVRFFDWTTAVVVMSAFADDEMLTQAERLGADAVLRKPFALEQFVEIIDELAPARSQVA